MAATYNRKPSVTPGCRMRKLKSRVSAPPSAMFNSAAAALNEAPATTLNTALPTNSPAASMAATKMRTRPVVTGENAGTFTRGAPGTASAGIAASATTGQLRVTKLPTTASA